MLQAERILLSVFIGSFLLNLHLVAATDLLIVLSCSLLGLLYFIFSIPLLNKIPLKLLFKRESFQSLSGTQLIMSFILGLGLSEAVFGILFKALALNGADFLLTVSIVILLAGTLYGFLNFKKHNLAVYKRFLQRSLGFALWVSILLILPKDALLQYKFRDYPAYLEARAKLEADPGNEVLLEKLNKEIEKVGRKDSTSLPKANPQP